MAGQNAIVLRDGLNGKYKFVLNKNQKQLEKYQAFGHDEMNDIPRGKFSLTLIMTENIGYLRKLP